MREVLEFYLSLNPSLTSTFNLRFEKVVKPAKVYAKLPLSEDLNWRIVERPSPELQAELTCHLYNMDPIASYEAFELLRQILIKREGIKDMELKQKTQEEATKTITSKLSHSGLNIEALKIIQPLNISSEYRFAQSHIWDTKKDCLLGPEIITPEGLEKYLNATLEDKKIAKEYLAQMFLPATTVFDPTQSFGLKEQGTSPLPFFNVACPQPWKSLTPSEIAPQLFLDFLDFFIPDSLERSEVLQWLYTAAYQKNYYALVLCGVKGTGKGIFSTLAKRITAGSYLESFDAPESMGASSHFNSSLLNARLCVFDEMTINFKNKDRLKRLMNNHATLEGKGVDAQKNVKLWANFIISNNFPLENNLEWDDRRFLVPELTKNKIEKTWGVEKIDELVNMIEHNDQFICDVVNAIKKEIKYYRAKTNPLRTKLFYRIVYFSLSSWQKSLLDFPSKASELSAGEEPGVYPMLELRNYHKLQFKSSDDQDHAKRFAQNQTVSQFLENYRHGPQQIRVGTFKATLNKEPVIKYNSEFLKLGAELI